MLTTPPPSWAFWQPIINRHDVPDRATIVDAPEPIPVTARVVWGGDGEEHVPGLAIRWTRNLVLVELRDPRSATIGAWLAPADVRRETVKDRVVVSEVGRTVHHEACRVRDIQP